MAKPLALADRWALVTGASSGIGAEFARQLAARGMHLILCARRIQPMLDLASELHLKHGTQTEVIECDLSRSESLTALEAEIANRGIEISLLVNNAGYGIVGTVDEADPARIQNMLALNIAALTDLTYRFLPSMKSRGLGAIINLSSLAAFQPVAFMGPYAASKAYVLHFSEALHVELRYTGVRVLAVCPGVTRTDFFRVAGVEGWLKKHASLEVDEVVRAALKAVDQHRQYIVPGWRDYLLTWLVRFVTRKRAVMESQRYFRPRKSK